MACFEPKFYNVLKRLRPSIREEAEEVLHAIVCSIGVLDWDSSLRVYYKGRPISRSDISDLLTYMLFPYDEEEEDPIGYDKFVDALVEIGIEPLWFESNRDVFDTIDLKQHELKQKQTEKMDEDLQETDENQETDQENTEETDTEDETDKEEETDEQTDESGAEYKEVEEVDETGKTWITFKKV